MEGQTDAAASAAERTGVTDAATPDWFESLLHTLAFVIEAAGVTVIVVGAALATLAFLWRLLQRRSWAEEYHTYRTSLARGILLGLEFLVAADIIGTVAAEPNLNNLAVLAAIVLIRTFLSFSLEVEIEGRWPWRKGRERPERAS